MSSPTQHLKAKVRVKGRSTDFSRYGMVGLLACLAQVFEVCARKKNFKIFLFDTSYAHAEKKRMRKPSDKVR